jgi:hypothetical protein
MAKLLVRAKALESAAVACVFGEGSAALDPLHEGGGGADAAIWFEDLVAGVVDELVSLLLERIVPGHWLRKPPASEAYFLGSRVAGVGFDRQQDWRVVGRETLTRRSCGWLSGKGIASRKEGGDGVGRLVEDYLCRPRCQGEWRDGRFSLFNRMEESYK